jgi:tetratricopeptide (TPR) repeat protein
MKRFAVLSISLIFTALLAQGDTLMLKSGKSYRGTISRLPSGKIAIKTQNGTRKYDEDKISFKQSKFSAPRDGKQTLELLETKEYAKALPLFKKWKKRYDRLPTVWYEGALYGIGVCYANMEKQAEAIQYLEKLTETFPNTRFKTKAEYWLIELQTSGGGGTDVEKRLLSLLANKSTSEAIRAKVHQGLGTYYENKEMWKEALEQYVNVVVLYGDIDELQEQSQAKCAELFAQIGRTNEAVFYYTQLIEVYPQSERVEEAREKLSLLTTEKGE